MRVLVTGGAGFIGSHMVRLVLSTRTDWHITNLDALTYAGNLDNLADVKDHPHHTFVQGDICDAALVSDLLATNDVIIHMAAESHVDRSIADSAAFIRTNVLGTQTLLTAAADAGIHRFVHVSTDEVYGSLSLDTPDTRFTETSPIQPSSPYAASKAASDLLALAAWKTHELPVVVTRCSNNFGPCQFPEKVIPLFVTRLLKQQPVPLYGDGRNIRDWIHVNDHCEAVLRVLERGTPGSVYNIGADNEWSNRDLAALLIDLLGPFEDPKAMIQPVEDRKGHDLRYAIDSAKIRSELGWTPSRSAWPTALAETVEWYRSNPQWLARIASGAYRKGQSAASPA